MDGDSVGAAGTADTGWADALAELGRMVVGPDSLDPTLRRVTELAKQNLPGAEDVSITVVEDTGRPRTVVFTGRLAVDLDERQYRAGFGPCVDAAVTGQTLMVDTHDSSAYPEFGQVARRAGVRHILSVGMPVAQRTVGGMNVYGTAELPFDSTFVQRAEAFANYAELSTQLAAAIESRAVIEQAKGIIMGRDRCSADDAFQTLRRVSQTQNTKLHAVAQAIVDAARK
jgi:ANTAR domain-containing protein/GAF domain-containing protein